MLRASSPSASTTQGRQRPPRANDTTQKVNGSSLSLLKATSKVMAFLNGRKSANSTATEEIDNNLRENSTAAASMVQPLPQANTTSSLTKTVMMNARRSKNNSNRNSNSKSHNALRSTADQDSALEQYRHLFQNRPINNMNNNLIKIPLPTNTASTTTTIITPITTATTTTTTNTGTNTSTTESGTVSRTDQKKNVESAPQTLEKENNSRDKKQQPRRRTHKRPTTTGTTRSTTTSSSSSASSTGPARRVQSGDIRQLGVNTNTRHYPSRRKSHSNGSSTNSSTNSMITTNNHIQPVHASAHFGGVKLLDIVRGLESEFTLVIDPYSGVDDESEDSRTCLLSEREVSTDEDDGISAYENASRAENFAQKLQQQQQQQQQHHQEQVPDLPPRPPSTYKDHILYQEQQVERRPSTYFDNDASSSSASSSSSFHSSECSSPNTIEPASSASSSSSSPESTLLNSSSDSGEDAVSLLILPSPETLPTAVNSSIAEVDRLTLVLEEPPQYNQHQQDQSLVVPSTLLEYQQQQRVVESVSASILNELLEEEHQRQLEAERKAARAEAAALTATLVAEVEASRMAPTTAVKPSLTLQTMTHTLGGIAPSALSAFECRPQSQQFSLTKCNSTSSLYIDSTMTKSDVDETLRAVATVLYDKILLSHKVNDCRTSRIVNSSSYVPSERVIMTRADVFDFMRFIFDCGQNLGAENAIITLIYVERMTELGNLSFHAINWRRLLLGALILSIKVWEDLAVFNSDVCAIFEGLNVKDVNALERFSMAKLQYNVSVKRSIYAAYFFRLRDVSEQEHNLHYGKLTLSMSQRDMQRQESSNPYPSLSHNTGSRLGSIARDDSRVLSNSSSRSSGLMGMATAINKVPVGPGYRKWTLKPLSVREADRLEARSALYCSNMRMEEQERRDVGCCWDDYSAMSDRASPAELSASMHTITSIASIASSGISSASTVAGAGKSGGLSTSTSTSSNATMISASTSDLVGGHKKIEAGSSSYESGSGATEPPRRVLRLKKSRSDFFFQNTTPASIM
ncbi:hypothetical protein BGZ83_006163 [Gryganskiella cystojenkinii]|nr:hypothetical protein BGZ83_006163 [Gryganskiella cystojenkinii]